MSNRSSLLVFAAALFGCFALAACGALAAGGYFLVNNPAALAFVNAPAAVNRIVYVGNDANIYVTDPDSGDNIALTTDGGDAHAYNFPTWSPDNQRLAFVGYTFQDGSASEGALYTVTPRGDKLTPLFKTPRNFPFYLYWSPDSQFVGFLSNQDAGTIALSVAHVDEADSRQELDAGSPFYWAWSPDSARMFTHVGGTRAESDKARLAVLDLQNQAPQPFNSLPGAFQAPQWTRDGKILFSTQDGDTQSIALTDAQAQDTKTLTAYRGRASFAMSPDGSQVAYLVTAPDFNVPHFGPVRVVDTNGENMRAVSPENALAFLWSPDSRKLAFLTVEFTENQQNLHAAPPFLASNTPGPFRNAPRTAQGGERRLQLQWKVWDSATNEIHSVATFLPTLSFLNVLPYFDQYANSSTFWSPDSAALVYTARENETDGAVWVADITGKTAAKKVGQGVLAFWSWR